MKDKHYPKDQDYIVFWFRRDLRLADNTGLRAALQGHDPVLPLFIFDPDILEKLDDKYDKRIAFIHASLETLKHDLESMGSTLLIEYMPVLDVFKSLVSGGRLKAVYANHDYEPYATIRDKQVTQYLAGQGIGLVTFKDQVIFEKGDIVKADGNPYTVFTPYSRRWMACYESLPARKPDSLKTNFIHLNPAPMPALKDIGFQEQDLVFPSPEFPESVIATYHETRNLPAHPTSLLGIHLRFGTVSIRDLVEKAYLSNKVFLNELIWREFFMNILFWYPNVTTAAFKPEYDRIQWLNDPLAFAAWCEGRTGFPLVDAGMRELSATGFMHNRVRMVAASFLVKDLLIDWRWGEAWFAQKLLDYELSANNGNWQWAAGCGCDAAPYFRIFNPEMQMRKFDPDHYYIRRWLPEYGTEAYAKPITDHKLARERCLKAYKLALSP